MSSEVRLSVPRCNVGRCTLRDEQFLLNPVGPQKRYLFDVLCDARFKDSFKSKHQEAVPATSDYACC